MSRCHSAGQPVLPRIAPGPYSSGSHSPHPQASRQSVNLVLWLERIRDVDRVGEIAELDWFLRRDARAAGRKMWKEERADFLHPLPPGSLVFPKRRPNDAARRGFGLLGGACDGGCEGCIGVIVDETLPHCPVACEFDDLDVTLCQPAERQHCERVLVQ